MTVNVSKPALNVREKLAELDKPTGIAGEAMLRAETPQEQQALIGVGRRNAVINGGFDVWQRGTSISLAAGTYYSADRWVGYSGATGRTHSQDTTEALSIGFKNCGKFVTGTAGPSFYQRIEDVRTFAGQTVTLSFWMKADKYHKPNWQLLQQNFGAGGSGTVSVSVGDLGEVNTEWKYFTATVTLPSVEGKTIGDGSYLLVYPCVMSASTTYWITGVQLELGKVATPFEHRSYGEELALCQRYYQTIGGGDWTLLLYSAAADNYYVPVSFNTPMRVNPTKSISASLVGSATTSYIYGSGVEGCYVGYAVGATAGRHGINLATITLDAEL